MLEHCKGEFYSSFWTFLFYLNFLTMNLYYLFENVNKGYLSYTIIGHFKFSSLYTSLYLKSLINIIQKI